MIFSLSNHEYHFGGEGGGGTGRNAFRLKVRSVSDGGMVAGRWQPSLSLSSTASTEAWLKTFADSARDSTR